MGSWFLAGPRPFWPACLCMTSCHSPHWWGPFQLLEYQWREGSFDTLGKLVSAPLMPSTTMVPSTTLVLSTNLLLPFTLVSSTTLVLSFSPWCWIQPGLVVDKKFQYRFRKICSRRKSLGFRKFGFRKKSRFRFRSKFWLVSQCGVVHNFVPLEWWFLMSECLMSDIFLLMWGISCMLKKAHTQKKLPGEYWDVY